MPTTEPPVLLASDTTLSVLICTYNRPDMLARCLAALLEHSIENPDQLVVVNGGSDEADSVVLKYVGNSRTEVKLVRTINKNLAASRNVGLPHCTGDIVAMTDDDAEVFPDWVSQMKRLHINHPEAGGIGGHIIGANNESLLSRISDEVTFKRHPNERRVRNLPGVNVSYKREVVKAVGPQDETLFRGEDVDYNWRISLLGYEILYHPDARVLHHHRPTLRRFFNQHYMYGRAYYLVRHKWPEMYCVYPHRLRRLKDFVKAFNFLVGVIYEPFLYGFRLNSYSDKISATVILIVNGLFWRGGIIRQKLLSFNGTNN